MLTQKVRWLSRVFYMPLWNRSGIISSVEGNWLDVTLTRSLFTTHNFYATARKVIYALSLLDSGRQIFHWSKLTMLSPWVQPWVRGRSAGSFPEQRLVIEPINQLHTSQLDTPCWRDPIRSKQLSTVAIWLSVWTLSCHCPVKLST